MTRHAFGDCGNALDFARVGVRVANLACERKRNVLLVAERNRLLRNVVLLGTEERQREHREDYHIRTTRALSAIRTVHEAKDDPERRDKFAIFQSRAL